MFCILATVLAALDNEGALRIQNQRIFHSLTKLADSNHFSKIKMSFNDKCPIEATKKCGYTSCSVQQMVFQGKEGFIDLSTVKEAFSKVSLKSGSKVWAELYKLAQGNEAVEKLLSGLHYSVTTHLTLFHTKLFNYYFSHPLLFKKRFQREYKENFHQLYKTIRLGVASLSVNDSEMPEAAKEFSFKLRRLLADERDAKRKNVDLYKGISRQQKSTLEKDNLKDVERDDDVKEQSSTDDFLESLPRIDESVIEILNQFPKHIACLECQKCKLWGTIQAKGIKAAVKAINRMPLYKNDIICLINLFRQLTITMEWNGYLETRRFPQANLLIICHKEILSLVAGVLFSILVSYRIKRAQRRIKLD